MYRLALAAVGLLGLAACGGSQPSTEDTASGCPQIGETLPADGCTPAGTQTYDDGCVVYIWGEGLWAQPGEVVQGGWGEPGTTNPCLGF